MKKKETKGKRLLCLVLCCILLVGIFPISIFAVQVDKAELDPGVAGVYGWRLLDKEGNLVGGVRYPADGLASHEGNSMDLNPYLSGLTDSGWGQYETADVYIGNSKFPLTENEAWDAMAESIKNDYRLEIFLVNTHGEYDAATGTFPYAWVEYDLETVTPSYNPNYTAFKLDFEGSGGPVGPSGFHWDYASSYNGPREAIFVVSVTDIDRDPDMSQSGVYGWRIRDDSGAVVGGVRYPNPAGWPDQMNLDSYFTEGNYIGNRWTDGNYYEYAQVHLGSAGMLLDTQENVDKFIQKLVDSYTLEIFFVQADAASYKNGKYPCKWVDYEIKGALHLG